VVGKNEDSQEPGGGGGWNRSLSFLCLTRVPSGSEFPYNALAVGKRGSPRLYYPTKCIMPCTGLVGPYNATKYDIGGVWFGYNTTDQPTLWQQAFPPEITTFLATYKTPHITVEQACF
jgi:hypothetical protein